MRFFFAYLRYRIKHGYWPSRLQRLYMRGDPTGECRRIADQILRELEAEDNG